jgi:glycosyltransferase involved in cell wall biosynthesis
MSERPFFSIVIPALNEEKYLPNLLEDLSNQTNTDFEILVVEGHSDDATRQVALEFKKKLSLEVITVEKRNVSYQRNVGGEKASGEWIVFMDADNRLPNDFLEELKHQIVKRDDFDIFTTWIDANSDGAIDQSTAGIINLGLEIYQKILQKPSAFGALIGVKSTIFSKHKFDEHQQVLEDSLFVQNVIKDGYRFRVLRKPQFIFSLRRMKKEGTLKTIRTASLMNLRYLQGHTFEDSDYGYTMAGGSYYEQPNSVFFQKIQSFLETASKHQLHQAKKIINSIKEFEL